MLSAYAGATSYIGDAALVDNYSNKYEIESPEMRLMLIVT